MRLLRHRLICEPSFEINVIYGYEGHEFSTRKGINLIIPVRSVEPEELFRVFDKVKGGGWIERRGRDFILDIDLVRFALWILSREEEYIQGNDPDAWDKHGRFRIEKTMAYQKDLWQKPVLDILILQLIERIEEELCVEILNKSPWGNGKGMALWMTHDVDRLTGRYALPLRFMGWAFFAIKELSKGNKDGYLKWIGKIKYWLNSTADPTFESIKRILDEEHRLGLVSTFYLMSLTRGVSLREGIRYRINHPLTKEAMALLKRRGCWIGLHPGYFKPLDVDYLIVQKKNLERAARQKVGLVRNHYLRIRYPDTWSIEGRAGFRLSSNMAWAGHNGFRAGTCWPYQPFDIHNNRPFSIVEVPPCYTDRWVDDQEIVGGVSKIANEVSSVHGLLTINFHSDLWSEFDFPARGRAFQEILQILGKDGWHFLGPEEIFQYFRQTATAEN